MAQEQLQRPERNCVEVARNLPGLVAVRDSKEADGVQRVVAPEAWRVFVRNVRA